MLVPWLLLVDFVYCLVVSNSEEHLNSISCHDSGSFVSSAMRLRSAEPRCRSWYVHISLPVVVPSHSFITHCILRFHLLFHMSDAVSVRSLFFHHIYIGIYFMKVFYGWTLIRLEWKCRLQVVTFYLMKLIWLLLSKPFFPLRTEQEGEADWIFDADEVMGNGIGAKHENNNVDVNVDLAEVRWITSDTVPLLSHYYFRSKSREYHRQNTLYGSSDLWLLNTIPSVLWS